MTQNSELKAMNEIYTSLKDLDLAAQQRVLNWVTSALGIQSNTKPATPTIDIFDGFFGKMPEQSNKAEEAEIGELFSAASPKTDAEKVLVVGSFLQTKVGKKELTGREINDELRHLGHGVGNVTMAIGTLMSRKPQLMIQTKKEGKTKQAQKKYKVTTEGLKALNKMLTQGEATEQ